MWVRGGKEREQRGLGVQKEECFFSSESILNCALFTEVMVSRLSNQFHQTNPTVSTSQDPTQNRERGRSVHGSKFCLHPQRPVSTDDTRTDSSRLSFWTFQGLCKTTLRCNFLNCSASSLKNDAKSPNDLSCI